MRFNFTKVAIEEIELSIRSSLDLEPEKGIDDLALIIYLRNASCGPMTEGGWKEVACTVDFFRNYQKEITFMTVSDQLILNLSILIDVEAMRYLEARDVIEVSVTKGRAKELEIVDAPLIDGGACKVKGS